MTKTYDGVNDNDDDDIELHGKLVVYWEWFDDGEYEDPNRINGNPMSRFQVESVKRLTRLTPILQSDFK
jgi:hypothetical protein